MRIVKQIFVLCCLLVSFSSLAIPVPLDKKFSYAVLVDAGSTGSRVHIYRYQKPKNSELPKIELMSSLEKGKSVPWRMKITPGISSFSRDLSNVPAYLNTLVQYAKTKLGNDPEVIKKTPLFFQATGGVRSLSAVDQKILMEKVQTVLSQSGFQNVRSEAISGSIEGVYQWLTVNYLEGNLEKAAQTRGIIEMGGASMQVTFLPKKPPKQHAFPLKLGNRTYVLYSYSYDGLGETSAVSKWQNHDCQAGGNYHKCKKSLIKHLSERQCSFDEDCGLNGIYQAPVDGHFWAIDNFHDIGTLIKKPYFSAQGVEELGEKVCGKTVKQLETIYPNREKRDLEIDCFDLAYFSLILSGDGHRFKGIGFHKKTEQIEVVAEIKDFAISWTLGSLLYQIMTSNVFTKKPVAV